MKNKIPENPYPIDFDQTLLAYAFFKNNHEMLEIDQLIANFLSRVTAKTFRLKTDIILWRGEYEGSITSDMWVIGVAADIEEKVADELFSVVSNSYDDAGNYARINTGAEPYLLISGNQIWLFNYEVEPNSKGTIVLGDKRFNVRYLSFATSLHADKESRKNSDLQNDELMTFLKDWSKDMSESASENWETVRKAFARILSFLEVGVAYKTLLWICRDIVRIPVFEIPMKSLGRTIVRPVWEDLGDEFVVKDYSVAFAVQKNLNENLKLLSLAHEFGHFVHHHPHLIFLAQLYTTVQDRPWIEFEVLNIFGDLWPEQFETIAEARADICASYFIIPYNAEKMLRETERKIFSTSAYSTDAQLITFLRSFYLSDNKPISFKHADQIVKEAFEERKKKLDSLYDQKEDIFKRMVWCIFNRDKYLEELNCREANIEKKYYQAGLCLFTSQVKKPYPKRQKRFIFKRLDKKAFFRELSLRSEKWGPIIVEHDAPLNINGYIGLSPAFFEKSNHPEMKWSRWEAPLSSPVMDIESWFQLGREHRKGIMFFPLTPIDTHLRKKIQDT